MGSSPSYEVQTDGIKHSGGKGRKLTENGKESVRASKNRQKEPPIEANPEQQNQFNQIQPNQPPTLSQHQIRSQKDPNQVLTNAPQATHQQIPIRVSNKKPPVEREVHEQEKLEAQNALETELIPERQMQHRDSNKKKPISNPKTTEESEEHYVHEPPKGRHYFKASTHQQLPEQPLANPSGVVKKTHRRSEQLNYKQFDSAHIRHKAMQEVGHGHHPHPIIARQPVYQHENLYPKILKGVHHEQKQHGNTPNRHYQHEHNVEEEAYEQPHKLHLYKRHIMHNHTPQHEQKALQKSMEVRAHPEDTYDIRASQNPTPRPKINSIQGQAKRPKVKSHHDEEDPTHQQANFRKRKPSMPNEEAQKRGRDKLQELEEKSIADINKEREFNVTEYEADPTKLVTCQEGCGRKFQADRIKKHEAICRRVFQQQRAAFDAQDHRIVSKQQRKLLKKGGKVEDAHHKKGGVPKWKAQSIALRAHIKMGLDSHYQPDEEEAEMLSQEHHIDIVTCPVCQRHFNKNAAKTHIPFCKAQLEKQLERERFEKPKTKR